MPLLPRTVVPILDETSVLQGGIPVFEAHHADSAASRYLHDYPAGYVCQPLTANVCGDGCEPVQDATLAWRLHLFFEDTEMMQCVCAQCSGAVSVRQPSDQRTTRPNSASAVVARAGSMGPASTPSPGAAARLRDLPPPVMGCDGVKDLYRSGGEGVRGWPGQRRFAVYGHVLGQDPVNFGSCQRTAREFAATLVALNARPAVIPAWEALPVPDHVADGGGGSGGVATGGDTVGQRRASSAAKVPLPIPCPPNSNGGVATSAAAPAPVAVSVFARDARLLLSDSLLFDSAFECGNLKRAERVFQRFCGVNEASASRASDAAGTSLRVHQEYDLWLREDVNTKGTFYVAKFLIRWWVLAAPSVVWALPRLTRLRSGSHSIW